MVKVVKVVKAFSPTFGFGGLRGSLRETWRKSLHNLHNLHNLHHYG